VFLLLFRFYFPRLVRPLASSSFYLFIISSVFFFFWLSLCYYNPANKVFIFNVGG
jgi:hypothetical protein